MGHVVIVDTAASRKNWTLGRITEVYPYPEGNIRVVRLISRLGPIMRTTTLLYPLEDGVDSIGFQAKSGSSQ